ncbi:MAG: hypothetical protein ACYTG5_12140 [Planctomycetota bacterium]|jgi:hypothetical protein
MTPTMVEDLFLTDSFLIKGRFANKYHRLSKMLEDNERQFVCIEDAVMYALRNGEVVHTPSVLVNTSEIILAHELVDVAGDLAQKTLADNKKSVRIRAFYSGAVQLELAGKVDPVAYEPGTGPGRRFFIMQEPVVRGLNLAGENHLDLLKGLGYAIVQKEKLAYIYDLGV